MQKYKIFCDRCGKEIEGESKRWRLARFERPAYDGKSYDICADCKDDIIGGVK